MSWKFKTTNIMTGTWANWLGLIPRYSWKSSLQYAKNIYTQVENPYFQQDMLLSWIFQPAMLENWRVTKHDGLDHATTMTGNAQFAVLALGTHQTDLCSRVFDVLLRGFSLKLRAGSL